MGNERNRAIRADECFFTANEYLEKKDYENALFYYETALSLSYSRGYLYNYGYCLMETGDYENAEKAFKIMQKINYPGMYYNEPDRRSIYTFDNNGIIREFYFSYYNLACIYARSNRYTESFYNLVMAVKYGYPYMNHMLSDSDLDNLFNLPFSAQIKEVLNAVYNAGSADTVKGKIYRFRPSPNGMLYYVFYNDNSVKLEDPSSDISNFEMEGTFRVSNYHVIINYTRKTGGRGENAIASAGVNTIYDKYIDFDDKINETELISLTYMAAYSQPWEETEAGRRGTRIDH
jgi:tetratricopeptide (TPR) repeat protein